MMGNALNARDTGTSQMTIDTEDKQWWCKHGETLELEFVKRRFDQARVSMNPAKQNDPYTFDMIISLPCDLKTCTTPWRMSQEMFGIDPKNAVSINKKDLVRYSRLYPNIVIIFDVQYEDHKTARYATMRDMMMLKRMGKLHEHFYQNRAFRQDGNAKSSFVFDVTYLRELKEEDGQEES